MKLFYGFSLYSDFYELIIFILLFHYKICEVYNNISNKSEEFKKIYSKLEYMSDESDFRNRKNQIYIYNSQISKVLNNHYKDNKKKFIYFDLESIYVLINESYSEKWFYLKGQFQSFENYCDLTVFADNNNINFIISYINFNKLNFNLYQKNLYENNIDPSVKKFNNNSDTLDLINLKYYEYYEYFNNSIYFGKAITCHIYIYWKIELIF